MGEAIPLKNKEAKTILRALVDSIFTSTGGLIRCLVHDQGSEFKREVKQACELLKVDQRFTASHRSMRHGLIERYIRTLKDTLRHMVNDRSEGWELSLPWAKLAYNSSIHRALSRHNLGISPAEVHLGRQLNIPMEFGEVIDSVKGKVAPHVYAQHIRGEAEKVREHVLECRRQYNEDMTRRYNEGSKQRGVRQRQFKVGDTVWVRRELGGGSHWAIYLSHCTDVRLPESTAPSVPQPSYHLAGTTRVFHSAC